MAARHVDVVERMFGLSDRCAFGDVEALNEFAASFHDDAEIESWLETGSAERGGTAIRAYFAQVPESYDEWHCVLDYVQDYGERVLALGAVQSVEHGGVGSEHAVGWIFTFRDDKIASMKAYPSYGDALRAVTSRAQPASR